ncbi:hypothetical protein HanIR_Chr04g0154681 [Helianthus annuus]|nr:hypothetical protein HanIR_Chr04g0154681 [Helianthus annuus]
MCNLQSPHTFTSLVLSHVHNDPHLHTSTYTPHLRTCYPSVSSVLQNTSKVNYFLSPCVL